jgi:outer membrane protein
MNRKFFCLLCLTFISHLFSDAQDKWNLRRCVDYAVANNISVKQADLQVRFSELAYKQDKGAQLPTLNSSINTGYSFGLSENPTTGVLENQKRFSLTPGLQSSVTLFNWFSIKNAIESSKIALEAEKAQVTKVQNDIALNVAVAYLQILLAKQQADIADVQVKQTQSQLDFTSKQVRAGNLPELNLAELQAQIAADSSSLISAQASVQQFILQLKALLNLDAALPFDVVTPPVDMIPIESIADLQPDNVYQLAVMNLPQQRVNELRIQSAQKTVKSARGQMYPSIGAFGNINTRYTSFRIPNYSKVLTGYEPTGLRVTTSTGIYDVESPKFIQGSQSGYIKADPLGTQLSNYFGQGIGIGIQIPIFNGSRARLSWNRAQLTVQQLQLQNDLDKQTLKQDIYRAYNDAVSSLEKYNASQKAVAAADKAYSFAQKRYNANLLSTYDLLNSQSRLARARLEMVSAQFDYVFKMKLLEFYKGQGLKL